MVYLKDGIKQSPLHLLDADNKLQCNFLIKPLMHMIKSINWPLMWK
jgi:hypothetical protein